MWMMKYLIIGLISLPLVSFAPVHQKDFESERKMKLYYDTYHWVTSEQIKAECIRKQRTIMNYKEFKEYLIEN